MFPTTAFGKLLAFLCMIVGLLVLALPITVVGSNFADLFAQQQAYAKAYREVDKAQAKRVKLVGVLSRRVRRLFVARSAAGGPGSDAPLSPNRLRRSSSWRRRSSSAIIPGQKAAPAQRKRMSVVGASMANS